MKRDFIRKITVLLVIIAVSAISFQNGLQDVKASDIDQKQENTSIATYEGTQTYQISNEKKNASAKVKFKKKTLWAFSNGGFYLRINSVKGRKMNVSIHMPQMNGYNLSATIDSSGKKATAYCSCSSGGYHVLIFKISGSGETITSTFTVKNVKLDSSTLKNNSTTISTKSNNSSTTTSSGNTTTK